MTAQITQRGLTGALELKELQGSWWGDRSQHKATRVNAVMGQGAVHCL